MNLHHHLCGKTASRAHMEAEDKQNAILFRYCAMCHIFCAQLFEYTTVQKFEVTKNLVGKEHNYTVDIKSQYTLVETPTF